MFMFRSSRLQQVTKSFARRGVFSFSTWHPSLNTIGNTHPKIADWVTKQVEHMKPDRIHICDGSDAENKALLDQLVKEGTITKLNDKLRPNSYLARSDPTDVARVEKQTYICSEKEIDAGPTNNWMEPNKMKGKLSGLFDSCMTGRTAYVMPFCMGPLGSPLSKYGVQITDSPYVVANMRIMTRMGSYKGEAVLPHIKCAYKLCDNEWVKCLHTVGKPLAEGEKDVPWPCNDTKYIVQFPEERSIVSYGSGYGGNALLGKKCLALRIASKIAKDEGWLAEHMLILGITPPGGEKKFIAAAFPSACGKTNLAMLRSTLPGWKVECVGDDISWMRLGKDGRLYAINPEAGFFGVAPGTSNSTNFNAMESLKENVLFTNVALTPEGDIWWEGMDGPAPEKLTDWTGQEWTPDCGRKAAHPNARFTAPMAQCPVADPAYEDPVGVPISAFMFGGRRSSGVPLVTKALDWDHGVFSGASISSEQTAAAEGKVGSLRFDPFAMLPFCGYNMGDYINHWLSMKDRTIDPTRLPDIFVVNWFRKDKDGKFLWPGFGDNGRVLKWVVEQTDPTTASAEETPIGFIPKSGALDTDGLDISEEQVQKSLKISADEYLSQMDATKQFFESLGERVPKTMYKQIDRLTMRLEEEQ